MKHYWLLFIVVLGGFAVVFGGIPPGYAQEDDDDEFQLEDIVVTAMKREQDHQRVPIQMEVISGTDLAGTEKDNIDDILREVSNIMINKSSNGMQVTLRGIANDEQEGGAGTDLMMSTPTVAINVDGAYEGNSTAGQNLFDIERVEVLAGPQSTMYGSNSPGGIVNVITAAPKTDRFEVKAAGDFGNYGHQDLQAVVNVPILKDKLAMRLSTQHYKRDNWVVGQTMAQDTETYRIKTLWEPNDKISVGFTYNNSTAASGGRLGGTVWLFDYEDGQYFDGSPVINPWTSDAYGEGKLGKGVAADTVPSTRRSERKSDGWRADINVETPIGHVSFVPYSNEMERGGIQNDVEVSIGPEIFLTTWERMEKQEEKGAELRIVSHEDFPFEWIIGGTLYESDQTGYTDDYTFDFNDVDVDVNRDNKAVYANITYPFTDRFRGNAGYRRSWDDARFQEVPAKVKDGITGQEYEEPDYKLGFEYDLAQQSMLFANWSTSYRVNTMADSTDDRPVPPERLDAYTVGVKNRFFNDRVQLNASAFYYDYRDKRMHPGQDGRVNSNEVVLIESNYPWPEAPYGDPQGTDFNNDGDYNDTNIPAAGPIPGAPPGTPPSAGPPPGLTSDLVGGFFHDPWESQWGDFESYGIDISFDAMITRNDLFGLNLSYIDTEWVDGIDEFYWKGYFSVDTRMGEEGRVYNGLRNSYSPEWSVSARYEHRFDLGNFGMLVPQIDMQYKSDYDLSFRAEDNPWNQQEGYIIWNASLVYRHPSDRWSLRAYMKNIDDYAAKLYYHQMFGVLADTSLGLNDPRLYGLVLSVNLDW